MKLSVNPHTVVGLSAWDYPSLPYYLDHFQAAGIEVKALVCAGRISEKSLGIERQRTEGYFIPKDILKSLPPQLPVYFVESHNSSACRELLDGLNADLLLNWGTPNILSKDVIALARLGVINAHPGLLPDYRGCTCVEWAIYNDEPVGATCHFMTEKIDEGAILYKEPMAVESGWSYQKIRTVMISHCIHVMIQGVREALRRGVTSKDMEMIKGGRYYKVIDDTSLAMVMDKINQGTYAHFRKAVLS